MPKNSQNNQTIIEPEIDNSGVDSSEAILPGGAGEPASLEEVTFALRLSQEIIAKKDAEIARLSQGANSIDKLAELLAAAIKPTQPTAVPNPENLNRAEDYRNARATVDGRSLMEAQQTLQMFRNEPRRMISIPRHMANAVGSILSVTVNGVQVRIPCDGKSYPINETHYEHIRERLAKIDHLASNTTPNVVEIN